jgi:hypothetical protein
VPVGGRAKSRRPTHLQSRWSQPVKIACPPPICAATLDLLCEVGYAKLTMGEVASRAAVAIPGLLGEMTRDPVLEQRLRDQWYPPVRTGFATVMAQARRRGHQLRRTPPPL